MTDISESLLGAVSDSCEVVIHFFFLFCFVFVFRDRVSLGYSLFLSVRYRKREAGHLEVSSISIDLTARCWENRNLTAIKQDLRLQC